MINGDRLRDSRKDKNFVTTSLIIRRLGWNQPRASSALVSSLLLTELTSTYLNYGLLYCIGAFTTGRHGLDRRSGGRWRETFLFPLPHGGMRRIVQIFEPLPKVFGRARKRKPLLRQKQQKRFTARATDMRAPRSSPPPWWRLKNSWPQGLGVFIHVMLLFLFLSQFTAGAFAKEAGPKVRTSFRACAPMQTCRTQSFPTVMMIICFSLFIFGRVGLVPFIYSCPFCF